MRLGARRLRGLCSLPDLGIRFAYYLFAEVDADQVVLEQIVVEHEFGGFAEIQDPIADRRRVDAVGHVLRVDRAGGVVVAADAADAARDLMRIPRVLTLHEHAIAAKDRRGGMALN